MKKQLITLCVTGILFILTSVTYSQNIAVNVTPPADTAGVCRENLFMAEFTASGVHTIQISSFVLNGNNPVTSSCGQVPVAPNVLIVLNTDSTTTTISNITVDTSAGTWTGTLNDTGTVRLAYHIYIDCSVIPSSPGSQSLKLKQVWSDPGSSFNYILNMGNDTLETTPVLFPFIADISPDAYFGSYLNVINERFMYKNTGNAAANMTFRFYPDSTAYCSQVVHLDLTYQVGLSSTPQPLVPGLSYPALLMPSDTLIIIQQVRDSSCIDSTCSALSHFYWQCNYGSANAPALCDHCQNIPPTDVQIRNLYKDTIRVERMLPADNRYDLSCYNDTASMLQWEYRITNPGLGALDSVFISLNGALSALNYLTLIPRDSLDVTISCAGCHVDSTITLRTNALCGTFITDPLASATYTIKNFHVTDTVFVRFKTFRCSEENNPALLNQLKYYNHWTFPVTAKAICGNNAVRQDVVQAGQLYYGANLGISSHTNNSLADITQRLIFTPSVTDLTVPQGAIFGDSTLMSIELKSLVQTPGFDYQLLGYNGVGAHFARGYVRATLHCDKGLRLSHPDSNARPSLLQSNGTFNYLDPVYFHSTVPDSCVAGDYFYYFDLSSPQSLNFFTQGNFEFMIQSCCTPDSGQTPFDVTFHLMANPDSCLTLDISDTTHTIPPPCMGIGCEWLPLSSIGGEIAVHCPGCLAPGMIIDHYMMRRSSYGLQDTDNDGRADSLNAVISDTTQWYMDRQQALKQQHSSFSDRLTDYLTAHFQAGDPSSGGYSYAQILNAGVQLPFLQLARRIPLGLDTMNLRATGLTLYIDTPVVSQPNCFECDQFHINTSIWRTQRAIHFFGNDVFQVLDTLTQPNLFLFTFESHRDSAGQLSGIINTTNPYIVHFSDSLSPFTGFFEGQGYRLKVNYDVCGNFMPGNNETYDLDNIKKQSTIFNKMWLSGAGHSTTGYTGIPQMINTVDSLNNAGWTLDPLNTDPTLTLINDSFASSFLFFCETYGGLHYFFAQDGRNQSSIIADTGCTKVINILAACRTAGYTLNPLIDIYPFEYWPNALWPQDYTVTVPPGYHITHGRHRTNFVASGNNRSSGWRVFPPPQISGTFSFNDSIFPSPLCITQNIAVPVPANDTNQYAGSKFTSRQIQFFVLPDSCAENLIYPVDTNVIVSFDKGFYPCLSDSTCTIDSVFSRQMLVASIVPPLGVNPALTIQVTPDSMLVNEQQVCVTVGIHNLNITDSLGVNSSAAGFVFIALPDSASVPFLTNWMFKSSGDTIYPTSGQILQLDSSLNVGGTITGQLCAQYSECQGSAQVNFHAGWNCDGFPTAPFDADSTCEAQLYSFEFTDGTVLVSTISKNHPLTYSLCDSFTITAPFYSNPSGYIYPHGFILDTLPPGLQILSVVAANCQNGLSDTLSADSFDANYFPITMTTLQNIGFTDGALSQGECIRCEVTLMPGCKYVGDVILPDIILDWVSFCGVSDTTISNFSGSIEWDSTSYCTNCFNISKTALQNTVFVGDTATFQIVVCGNNATAQTIAFTDHLPLNFVAITTIPDSVPVPAIGCDTMFISGYYTQSGYCGMPEMQNTATIYFNGDSLYDSACTDIYASCAAQADTIVADSTFTSTIPATVSNLTIFLAGRLYVNDLITFVNCTIFVNIGGQIIVVPGGGLVLDSTVIEGCDNMWQGVYLESATLGLGVERHSIIRDANWAVYANDKTSLKILNSSFEDNVRGIYVPPATGSLNNVSQVITGNHFGMVSSFFKQPYPGQPVFGSISYSGIEVNDIVWKIGEATADSNYFYNMNTGILGFRSALKVVNDRFNQIVSDDSLTTVSDWDGSAIASVGKLNSVYGKLIVEPVSSGDWTIERSERGVYTDISDLDIQKVKMTGMNTGIFSKRCTAPMQSFVSNCLIEADQFGIDWRVNNGSVAMTAKSNSIYMNGTLSFGILMRETSTTNTANYLVQGNYIQLQDGFAAVAGLNLYRSAVSDNIIGIKGTVTLLMAGIAYEGGLNNVINCNLIDGDSNTDTSKVGVIVNISERTTVSCNRTDSTGFGFHFGGISPLTSFRGNTMINHFNGLRLNNVAVIDTQSHAGNRWIGTYTDTLGNWGAMNMNAASFTELAKSLFEVNPTPAPDLLPSTPTATSLPNWPDDAGWFQIFTTGDAFVCDSIFACHFDHEEERKSSEELKLAIAGDSTITMDFIPESKAIAKEYLYTELKNDTSLISGNVLFSNFVNAQQSNAIGFLYQVTKSLFDASIIDSTSIDSLLALESSIKFLTESIFLLDSLEILNPGSQTVSKENLLSTLNTYYAEIESRLELVATIKTTALNTASQFNSLVQSGELPQLNERLINEIDWQYQLLGKEQIKANESGLLVIANQCPFKGGKAVYRARALLALINSGNDWYDDASVCASEGIYRNAIAAVVKQPRISLVPNPSSDWVDVMLSGYDTGVCRLDIYNEVNQLICTNLFNCTDNKFKLNTSNFRSGVYTVRILIEDTSSVTSKLIIIR
jgi:hypothetical protein